MIKLFILITALGMPWPCDCDERQETSAEVVRARCEDARAIRPKVSFYWGADEAAKAYLGVSKPDRARLFTVEFWKYAGGVEVKELQVSPAQSYEIMGSSTVAVRKL